MAASSVTRTALISYPVLLLSQYTKMIEVGLSVGLTDVWPPSNDSCSCHLANTLPKTPESTLSFSRKNLGCVASMFAMINDDLWQQEGIYLVLV